MKEFENWILKKIVWESSFRTPPLLFDRHQGKPFRSLFTISSKSFLRVLASGLVSGILFKALMTTYFQNFSKFSLIFWAFKFRLCLTKAPLRAKNGQSWTFSTSQQRQPHFYAVQTLFSHERTKVNGHLSHGQPNLGLLKVRLRPTLFFVSFSLSSAILSKS